MKKAIKIALMSLILIGGASFAYAKQQSEQAWMCSVGSTGHCVPDFFDPGNYDCAIPPGTIDWGDCGGTVKVVIPD